MRLIRHLCAPWHVRHGLGRRFGGWRRIMRLEQGRQGMSLAGDLLAPGGMGRQRAGRGWLVLPIRLRPYDFNVFSRARLGLRRVLHCPRWRRFNGPDRLDWCHVPVFIVGGRHWAMLNKGMLLVHFHRPHFDCLVRHAGCAPVNTRCPAVAGRLIANRNRPQIRMHHRRHALHRYAAINHGFVREVIIIDDAGAGVNSVHVRLPQPVMPRVRRAKIPERDKGEAICRQTEIKVRPDAHTVVKKPPRSASKTACSGSGAQPQSFPAVRHVTQAGPHTRSGNHTHPARS